MTIHVGGLPVDPPRDRLIEKWVYFVDVASFTFQFQSLDQLRQCLEFFKQKIHPDFPAAGCTLGALLAAVVREASALAL